MDTQRLAATVKQWIIGNIAWVAVVKLIFATAVAVTAGWTAVAERSSFALILFVTLGGFGIVVWIANGLVTLFIRGKEPSQRPSDQSALPRHERRETSHTKDDITTTDTEEIRRRRETTLHVQAGKLEIPAAVARAAGFKSAEVLPNWEATHEVDDVVGIPGVFLGVHSTDGDERDVRRCMVIGPAPDPVEWTANLNRSFFKGTDDYDLDPRDSFEVHFPREFSDAPKLADMPPGRYGVKWFAIGQAGSQKYVAGDCFEIRDGQLRDC